MDFTDRSSVRAFLKEKDIRDLVELNTLMKEMTGVLVEEMLEAERDAHLGYEKYAVQDKQTTNSRNGHSKKRVRSTQGNLELNIPRDRAGSFEPRIVGKHLLRACTQALSGTSRSSRVKFCRCMPKG